ncbi:cytochrome P450 [Embleya hyalina]|uniref:Cytochrome P450 n=1 Tax=Embleya hyalina TaxID=516124 RepID=A0A401YTD1_9ACTN|nr:cytochrome P450 [Embleya hyalina]GCD97873.1 cytochrome P450 [Embleya hyalina]
MSSSSVDLFCDATRADPYPRYAELRAQGSAIHLTEHDAWALPRYADVLAALTHPRVFSPVDRIAAVPEADRDIPAGTVSASDGPDHARLCRILSRQLARPAIDVLTAGVHKRADRLVRELVARETFDAARDLARPLVVDIVLGLMGFPAATRDSLLGDAAAAFDLFGPADARCAGAGPVTAAMSAFLEDVVTVDAMRPGSWLAATHTAAGAGEITQEEVVPLMFAYTTAGMDTTVHGISTAIHLLATHPGQFANLRNRRVTADQVFHEALRFDAPVQAFGRRVTRDVAIGDTRIPAGNRVWLLHGSAGRDERRWGKSADRFDAYRPDADRHLALGVGSHVCAGNRLATLQARAVLTALARRCSRIRPAGTPERTLGNVLRGWERLPLDVTPDGRRTARRAGTRTTTVGTPTTSNADA